MQWSNFNWSLKQDLKGHRSTDSMKLSISEGSRDIFIKTLVKSTIIASSTSLV